MSPNDNNPLAPDGAAGMGTSPVSPLDFTNPDTLNSTSSLSMSDSLASAEDSLTSAGQAAPSISNAIGLDQLGLDKPSASMDTPNQPLTPAAPVPGSIGSVTSVPPVSTPSSLGTSSTMPPVNSAPAAPNTTPVATSNMPNMGGSSSTSTGGSGRPYYNPFAATTSNSGSNSAASSAAAPANSAPTSSTSVPPALQPQSEKFSDRLNMTQAASKHGSNKLGIIGWVLAVLFLVSTIVLFILWQNAEQKAIKAANEKEIIYVDREPVTETLSMLNCSQSLGANEELGIEGLTWHSRDMSAVFKNDALSSMTLFNTYTFADAELAANSEWYFNDLNTYYTDAAANLGVGDLAITNELDDITRTYNIGVNADQLVGDFVGIFMLNSNEDGAVLSDNESIKRAYEDVGFICTVE